MLDTITFKSVVHSSHELIDSCITSNHGAFRPGRALIKDLPTLAIRVYPDQETEDTTFHCQFPDGEAIMAAKSLLEVQFPQRRTPEGFKVSWIDVTGEDSMGVGATHHDPLGPVAFAEGKLPRRDDSSS